MKILVTGAAGFIGYYVAKKLAEQGFEVIGLDNINDYYVVRLKFARLADSGIRKEKIKTATDLDVKEVNITVKKVAPKEEQQEA